MKPASPPETVGLRADGDPSGERDLPRGTGAKSVRDKGRVASLIGTPKRQILVGIGLLALVAIGGAYFAFEPGPTPLDRLAFSIIPSEYSRHLLTYIADLGRPRYIAPGVVICAFIAFFSDRLRALTCLVSPVVAIVITEYLAKPAVGRTFGGTLCYPSGHMTSVASLICAFVIAVPVRWRKLAAVLGLAAGIVVGVTLLLLRWHFLTDVIAGASVSIAATLITDALLHLRNSTPAYRSGRESH